MSDSQRASAVKRKRAVAQGVGGKPTNVKTFVKRKSAKMGGSMSPTSDKPSSAVNSMMKQAQKNYTGSFVSGSLGGVKVGNKSYKKFYSNPGYKMPKIS